MLYHIVKTQDDEKFEKCIEHIKTTYWPEQRYQRYIKDDPEALPSWADPPPEDVMIAEIREKLNNITRNVCREPLYSAIIEGGKTKEMDFPFIKRFHRFFLLRKWNEPLRDPRAEVNDLLCLYPHEGMGNYSKNYGNYNHFIKVVAALARLITYFQDHTKIRDLFGHISTRQSDNKTNQELDLRCKTMAYREAPSMRTFKLMLAAFYHDIGKTIVDPRHGMEGAIILADHTSFSRYQLNRIAKIYHPNDPDFEFQRGDLLFISDLLLYHDQYGTLGTGEDGYLGLVDVVDRIKRYSQKHNDNEDDEIRWSQKYLFDLWLLNIADIIVSLEKKYELQDEWMNEQSAKEKIENFFKKQTAVCRVHDLEISLRLLEAHNQEKHTDDISDLKEKALKHSTSHTVERLRRLATASLRTPLSKYNPKFLFSAGLESQPDSDQNEIPSALRQEFKNHEVQLSDKVSLATMEKDRQWQITDSGAQKRTYTVIKEDETLDIYEGRLPKNFSKEINEIARRIGELSEENWNSIIIRSIRASGDPQEFCSRLAWIGKMDYALGFFSKIAEKAFYRVAEEIRSQETKTDKDNDSPRPTGWISLKTIQDFGDTEDDDARVFYYKLQAQFFADNYIATVIQILSYLLFREQSIDRLRNIEFNDARNRLTDEKIDKIISLEGPFRSKKSIEFILRTVYIY